MSYVTVEVEIEHGPILPGGAAALAEKASGQLAMLVAPPLSQPRPII
jgi:hypothetical protein